MGLFNLHRHALCDIAAEHPHLLALALQDHPEEDAKAALLWVAFLHELRKQQVRRDGDTVLRHRKPAEIPRPSGIALDIPGKG